jgi:hypothetical protein
VTRRGAAEGKPVFYCDNDPVGLISRDDLDKTLLELATNAFSEFGREDGLIGPVSI